MVIFAASQCWLKLSLLSSRTSQNFSTKLLVSFTSPQHVPVHGVTPPQLQSVQLPLLCFITFLPAQLCISLVEIPPKCSTTVCCTFHSFHFYILFKLAWVCTVPSWRSLRERFWTCFVDSFWFPAQKSRLTTPEYLLILHAFGNAVQDNFLQHLPKDCETIVH